jgi:hypothetical protein
VAGIESNRMRSRCSLSSRERELAALVTVVVAGTSMRTYLMARSHDDREDQALVIEEIVSGMRRVIDQLSAAERKLILTSMRRKWSNIADRLEAPSSRNH